ncbi:hypothetical protein GCM10023210_03440 [Chryseobacterium ginsengisoli]|uniref:Lipoprotein n=1 Tax=Chryseobacterium ginsengisoli TaxID=363853 RepID=A0ABP9LRP2_9FLAO
MKTLNIMLLVIVLISCKKVNKQEVKDENYKQNIGVTESINDCPIDSMKMKISEFNGINFYSENTMRGKGVINISVDTKIEILNLDKTIYGSISPSKNDLIPYDIHLPKNVVAREIIPDIEFRIFDFDAEQPDNASEFVIIYVNKEKKLLRKKNLQYTFSNWDKYIKSAFIQLDSDIINISKEEQKYWYKAIQINADSMLIKSVSKTDCDYIEDYKDISKWIKWKNGNCKLIKLNFCY